MGGSGTGGGGGGSAPDPLDCRKVKKWTGLANPQRDVLKNISEGDVLRVRVHEGAIVVVADGQIVGAISEMWTEDLKRCIEDQQYSYEAEVVSLNGALCRVKITNRRA
jgi:hypothetical protein